MEQPQQERILWIDIARGLGILAIVLGHTLRAGYVKQLLYAVHVPLFFVLSGLTFREEEPFFASMKKRAYRVLLPYLLWGSISILLYALLGRFASSLAKGAIDTDPLTNLKNLLYGSSLCHRMQWNTPLWFLPCLFAVYLLAMLWRGMGKAVTGRGNGTMADLSSERRMPPQAGADGAAAESADACTPSSRPAAIDAVPAEVPAGRPTEAKTPGPLIARVLLIAALLTVGGAVVASGRFDLPFQLQTAVYMLGFFELGALLRSRLPELTDRIRRLSRPAARGTIAALITVGVILSLQNGKINLQDDDVGASFLLLNGHALCLIAAITLGCIRLTAAKGETIVAAAADAATSEALTPGAGTATALDAPGPIARALAYPGRRSLPILLMHKFPILLLQVLPFTKALLVTRAESAPLLHLLFSLPAAALSVALCLAAYRVLAPRLPFLFGEGCRKRADRIK